MTAVRTVTRQFLDELAADLADAAFPVAVRYGMKGSTVDGELDLWRAVRQVVRRQHCGTGASEDELVAEWTATVYETALRRGFTGPFLDLELALWRALADTEPCAARTAR